MAEEHEGVRGTGVLWSHRQRSRRHGVVSFSVPAATTIVGTPLRTSTGSMAIAVMLGRSDIDARRAPGTI